MRRKAEDMAKKFEFDDEEGFEAPYTPSIDEVIRVLESGTYEAHEETLMYGLSNLSHDSQTLLQPIWQKIDLGYRHLLLQTLIDESDGDYTLNYDALAHINLGEADKLSRLLALELLESAEDLETIERVLHIAKTDGEVIVQAEAVRLLAHYAYLGSLNELPARIFDAIYAHLVHVYETNAGEATLRGRALEALAYTDHPQVTRWIQEAYGSHDEFLRLSAIVAMGRTADASRWGNVVLSALETDDEDILLEVIRACGELQLTEAIASLSEFVGYEDNDALQETAVWALGEIGGREAIRILEAVATHAEDTENESLLEVAEDALATAGFIGGKFFGLQG